MKKHIRKVASISLAIDFTLFVVAPVLAYNEFWITATCCIVWAIIDTATSAVVLCKNL